MATTWTVTRTGNRVRVNIMEADDLKQSDTEAISVEIEGYLADDSVKVLHLNGPALMNGEPLNGLRPAMKHLGNLARSRGMAFDVGPI